MIHGLIVETRRTLVGSPGPHEYLHEGALLYDYKLDPEGKLPYFDIVCKALELLCPGDGFAYILGLTEDRCHALDNFPTSVARHRAEGRRQFLVRGEMSASQIRALRRLPNLPGFEGITYLVADQRLEANPFPEIEDHNADDNELIALLSGVNLACASDDAVAKIMHQYLFAAMPSGEHGHDYAIRSLRYSVDEIVAAV